MKDEDMKLENLRHVDVEIYEVLMTRIHQVMKDWGFTFNEAINLFLDWGSIHAVKFMERQREERRLIEEKKKKEDGYVN